MAAVKLFYGSTTGNTLYVAKLIAAAYGRDAVTIADIAQANPEDLERADVLILGISTWDMGEPQKDWANFLPQIRDICLAGKPVALYGLGDAHGFSGLFVNALRSLYDAVTAQGARVIGRWPTKGYTFDECRAIVNGEFVGLVIDQENQSGLTVERVSRWVKQVRQEVVGHANEKGGANGLLGGPKPFTPPS
ncbi:MAG: flavodoxin [Candidatus Hydrogenedentota bacterium]